MLTAAATADVATAAMKAGALDYLVNDRLDAEILRRAIGSAVRQFRLIEAQRVGERRNAQLAAIVAALRRCHRQRRMRPRGPDLECWRGAAIRL